MLKLKNICLFSIIILISACSSIPQNTSNSCSIFNERYLWYKHVKSVEKKLMSKFIYSLLLLRWNLILIGWQSLQDKNYSKLYHLRRPSSSFGYSQAVKGNMGTI